MNSDVHHFTYAGRPGLLHLYNTGTCTAPIYVHVYYIYMYVCITCIAQSNLPITQKPRNSVLLYVIFPSRAVAIFCSSTVQQCIIFFEYKSSNFEASSLRIPPGLVFFDGLCNFFSE